MGSATGSTMDDAEHPHRLRFWKISDLEARTGVRSERPDNIFRSGQGTGTMTQSLIFGFSRVSTPIGAMLVATDEEDRLRVLDWETHIDRMHRLLGLCYGKHGVRLVDDRASGHVLDRLSAFFGGDIAAIDDIPTESAGTPFQREVWTALRAIPAGGTWSYGKLARHIGRPSAIRAVGFANGCNPIGVVVPCHRVIGNDGSLTGYGGGLDRKQWLLRHEGVRLKGAP
jgi:methylated-DNA-[protein]-cysteine S-methyltransferase